MTASHAGKDKAVDAKAEEKRVELEGNVQASQEVALGDEGYGSPSEVVYLDRPGGPDAQKITLGKYGEVADTDVWEEVYPNNAKKPSYLLIASKGTALPSAVTHFTLQDYGPNRRKP